MLLKCQKCFEEYEEIEKMKNVDNFLLLKLCSHCWYKEINDYHQSLGT